MPKKSLLLVGLFCCLAKWGGAQATISISNYIQNRVTQLDNLPESSYIDKQFQSPWIDGMDFRTETDEFKLTRQRYLIRLSPNTPKIRKAQSNLHQLFLKKANLQNTLVQKDFIEIAYQEVLNYYEATRKLKLKEDLLLVLKDQEKVWRKLSQTSSQLPKDWLEIQQDIGQIEIDIFRETEALKNWNLNGNEINWDRLIAFDSILSLLDKNSKNLFHLQARAYDVDYLIIEREEELEQAEQKKLLDFLQLEYNGPHSNEINERVSLTAAFRLPFSASRKLKMEEIAIEKETLQQERLAEKQLDQYKEKEQRLKIQSLISELEFMKQKLGEQTQKIKSIADKSRNQPGGNPLFLLYQKETAIKNELDILKLEMTIYQEYLDYLSITELLYQSPFNYFLSN